MSRIADMAAWSLLRPRVTHRLPGRLRLRMPLLQRVPDEWIETVGVLETAVASARGIRRVQCEPRTGSMLIEYEADRVNEADVLAYLRSLFDLFRRHRGRMRNLSPASANCLSRRLSPWLRANTRHSPVLEDHLEIPDEFWSQA